MAIDHPDAGARLARLEQMVEQYRAAQKRQLLQRAIKLWRKTEAQQKLEERPERSH
jgi:DNA-binding transcriptional regulator YbjK